MTTEQKQKKIKSLVTSMLKESHEAMIKKIDNVLKSGAINVSEWEPDDKPMITPKCIVAALFEHESHQYNAKGTSFERQVKKEVKNIRYFL